MRQAARYSIPTIQSRNDHAGPKALPKRWAASRYNTAVMRCLKKQGERNEAAYSLREAHSSSAKCADPARASDVLRARGHPRTVRGSRGNANRLVVGADLRTPHFVGGGDLISRTVQTGAVRMQKSRNLLFQLDRIARCCRLKKLFLNISWKIGPLRDNAGSKAM